MPTFSVKMKHVSEYYAHFNNELKAESKESLVNREDAT